MPTLTVMEGREENFGLVDGFKQAAEKIGWDFLHLTKVEPDKIAKMDLADLPLDYVVFRELSGNDYYETERIMDYIRLNKKVGVNTNVAGGRTSTSDKYYQIGLFLQDPVLKEHTLPVYIVESAEDVKKCIKKKYVHYPVVLKPRRGTLGDDIVLIENDEDLDRIESYIDMVVEQYVEPECDFRVFVVGGAALGVIRKTGDLDNPGNFKAWCSGKTREVEKDKEVLDRLGKLATHAAAISGLEYAGIDIIRAKEDGRYYILETNIAASWSNFVPVTGINIPEIVLEWMKDRGEAKELPRIKAAASYCKKWKKYASTEIQRDFNKIVIGNKNVLKKYDEGFAEYGDENLCQSGYLYKMLKKVYLAMLETKFLSQDGMEEIQSLLDEIDKLPLSRMGNYIGPEVQILDEGLILSAMWFYILFKFEKV